MMDIDISTLPTPSYLVDQRLLIKNLELLASVKERTGCKILLAQKAFSMFSVYPLIAKYLVLWKPVWDMKKWEKKSTHMPQLLQTMK